MGPFLSVLSLVGIFIVVILIAGLRVVDQNERGVILTLGRYAGMRQPGLTWIFTFLNIQRMFKIDIRTKVADVPDQESITRDNVSVKINAVIYYRVVDASKAKLEVENYEFAVSQLAQTTMRNASGEVTLDELLANREQISSRIKEIVDKSSESWGIQIIDVELKDITLPEGMKRTIAKQAEAEREKRAVIINSEGEVLASQNLSKAAETLAKVPGALHLRTLQSINDMSSDDSNTVVFMVPVETLKAFDGFAKK
ncbi:MAG: slipin family protein [Patescibacteria group bacterium]|jgi:regulator of protease activity HflC (stomatin/prohibitin superfamily)